MPRDFRRTKAQSFYYLAKPGIVYGNALHIIACVLFAWAYSGQFKPWAMLGVVVGTALVIASACVINCITDRFIDAKMERTKKRPLPSGQVAVGSAFGYAIVLGSAGSILLLCLTNWVALLCALACHFTYTVVYAYVKRRSWLGTIAGTIPGALPALAGYAAVDPSLPPAAWLLTLVILVWQLPHFYALALYRAADYAKSGLPMISVVKPRRVVTGHIVATALLYAAVSLLLFAYAPGNALPGGLVVLAALVWVLYIVRANGRGSDLWARKVFGTSLYMPMIITVAGALAVVLA